MTFLINLYQIIIAVIIVGIGNLLAHEIWKMDKIERRHTFIEAALIPAILTVIIYCFIPYRFLSILLGGMPIYFFQTVHFTFLRKKRVVVEEKPLHLFKNHLFSQSVILNIIQADIFIGVSFGLKHLLFRL